MPTIVEAKPENADFRTELKQIKLWSRNFRTHMEQGTMNTATYLELRKEASTLWRICVNCTTPNDLLMLPKGLIKMKDGWDKKTKKEWQDAFKVVVSKRREEQRAAAEKKAEEEEDEEEDADGNMQEDVDMEDGEDDEEDRRGRLKQSVRFSAVPDDDDDDGKTYRTRTKRPATRSPPRTPTPQPSGDEMEVSEEERAPPKRPVSKNPKADQGTKSKTKKRTSDDEDARVPARRAPPPKSKKAAPAQPARRSRSAPPKPRVKEEDDEDDAAVLSKAKGKKKQRIKSAETVDDSDDNAPAPPRKAKKQADVETVAKNPEPCPRCKAGNIECLRDTTADTRRFACVNCAAKKQRCRMTIGTVDLAPVLSILEDLQEAVLRIDERTGDMKKDIQKLTTEVGEQSRRFQVDNIVRNIDGTLKKHGARLNEVKGELEGVKMAIREGAKKAADLEAYLFREIIYAGGGRVEPAMKEDRQWLIDEAAHTAAEAEKRRMADIQQRLKKWDVIITAPTPTPPQVPATSSAAPANAVAGPSGFVPEIDPGSISSPVDGIAEDKSAEQKLTAAPPPKSTSLPPIDTMDLSELSDVPSTTEPTEGAPTGRRDTLRARGTKPPVLPVVVKEEKMDVSDSDVEIVGDTKKRKGAPTAATASRKKTKMQPTKAVPKTQKTVAAATTQKGKQREALAVPAGPSELTRRTSPRLSPAPIQGPKLPNAVVGLGSNLRKLSTVKLTPEEWEEAFAVSMQRYIAREAASVAADAERAARFAAAALHMS